MRALLGWLGLCLAAGLAGAVATSTSVTTWYPLLAKPAWTPPSWLFGPVWTALYVAMAVAAWLVHRRGPSRQVRRALAAFATQLLLNAAWSWLFFGLRSPGIAAVEIVLLAVAILATLAAFARISRAAAALLVPYLAWVGFACALNVAIWRLN